ncbi:MAG: hypothetical protein ACI9SQ_000744 [Rubritalea sp.]|jgi:hypothetical protein
MSNKSNSNQQQTNEDSKKHPEDLSDDLDFWNIDTDPKEINTSADKTEQILAEKKIQQPLKSLSEQELVIKTPDEQDGIPIPPEPVETVAKIRESRTSVEKIATLACYLAILGVFSYLIIYASEQHNFDTTKGYQSNTPVKGDYANVEKIETWWSKPVGNNAKFGILFVPSATITLDSSSGSGVIRSVFYSYEEGLLGKLRPKGDPFTHEFVNGKFLESGNNQITIHGTDGFEKLSSFLFYRSQDENRWTVEVREAPSTQTEVNSFLPLANAPIDPIRK